MLLLRGVDLESEFTFDALEAFRDEPGRPPDVSMTVTVTQGTRLESLTYSMMRLICDRVINLYTTTREPQQFHARRYITFCLWAERGLRVEVR